MKTPIITTFIFLFTFLLVIPGLKAQCDFDVIVEVQPDDDDNIYCPDDVIILSTGDFDSYQWFYNFSNSNTGGTPVAGGNQQSISINAGDWALAYFYVEATDDGCAEPSQTVVWDSWVFAGVVIAHDPQSEYCMGDSALIEIGFQGPAFFQWFRDGLPIPDATESKYWVKTSGTYTLSAAWPECPNFYISSGVGPTFDFIPTTPPEITSNDTILTASYGNSFQWFFEGVQIPGATTSTFQPFVQGFYTVLITDDNGCSVSSEPFFFAISSSREPIDGKQSFTVFPNPAAGDITLNNHIGQKCNVEIYDQTGKILFTLQNTETHSLLIPATKWSPGVYICKIQTGDNFHFLKLMKI